MSEQTIPKVGLRLRMLREQRNLSLRALADRCGLSINAISLIERGENSPTVSSLHILATALGVKITEIFEEEHDEAVVFVKRNQRLNTEGNGLVMESLGIGLHNQRLEPFMVTIDPGAGDTGDMVVHPGQEFVYCMTGEIMYQIGSRMYRLTPGDSLLFEATQPHSFRNEGETPATVMLIFHAIEGSHLGRQRHLDL